MTALADFIQQHLFTCSVHQWLGIDCPGCGMQRAFVALLRGHLAESIRFNASLLPFLATVAYALAHLLFGFKHGARGTVVAFGFTVAVMFAHFIVKLSGHA